MKFDSELIYIDGKWCFTKNVDLVVHWVGFWKPTSDFNIKMVVAQEVFDDMSQRSGNRENDLKRSCAF